MTTAPTVPDDHLQGFLNRAIARFEEDKRFISTLPSSRPCPKHPHMFQLRDDRQSLCENRVMFSPCPLCADEKRIQADADRLHNIGVPLNLCHSALANWKADTEDAKANLARVRDFTQSRRGFLVLLGELGTGKSHLAVAVLRTFKSGLFVKQSELLRRLRQTYRDRAASDPVDAAQNADCLVLDEVGLSPGGKDELPLLHNVLDYRHGNYLPTIITANLDIDDLRGVLGARMADRLRESAFAVLNFGGQSYRRRAHERYFTAQQSRLPYRDD